MKLPPEHPIALDIAFALVRAAAQLVPSEERAYFEYDWRQKLYHRWQFLHHTQLWSRGEELKLLASASRAVPHAVQHFGAQDTVQTQVARFVQSPLTCLAGLLILLLAVGLFSRGLPATRDLFFKRLDRDNSRLVYVWTHSIRGGGDRPLAARVVEAWKTHSHLISSAAAFRAVHRDVQINGALATKRLVVTTEPSFFLVMATQPLAGSVNNDSPSVLLSYEAWIQLFHASPSVIGSSVSIAGTEYPIRGILPAGFEPISKQITLYLIQPNYLERDAYAAVRANPGVSQKALTKEFTDIAEDVTYYFLSGQLRFGFAQNALWTPVRTFAYGALASASMLLMVFRVKWRALWPKPAQGRAYARRSTFFAAKIVLSVAVVFTACLEWSRSTSAILFGNFDPATGPFLLWLYIIGTMGVFFWAAFDQKARCRECLQLLAFPVRMGSPGNLLLDWSGTELCCSEGHGVLHVPHLAPSWAEESDHWIALDDSWQGIFGRDKDN
jgi:hypothetical protein